MVFVPFLPITFFLLLVGAVNILLGIVALFTATRNNTRFIFFLNCLSLSLWAVVIGLVSGNFFPALLPLLGRAMIAVTIPLPLLVLLLSDIFPHGKFTISKKQILFLFCPLFFFLAVLSNNSFVGSSLDGEGYLQLKLGWLHRVYVVYYLSYFFIAGRKFCDKFICSVGSERMRYKYFFTGIFLASVIGIFCNLILTIFHIPHYVYFGPLGTVFFVGLTFYAIARFRLMDIQVAVTRAGLFVAVYLVILWLPFWLGFKTGQWIGSVALMGVMATFGRFVYDRLHRTAADAILKDERRYQKVIMGLAGVITYIRKELDTLLKTISLTFYNEVHPEFVYTYTAAKGMKTYFLKCRHPEENDSFCESIPADSPLLDILHGARGPVFIDLFADQRMPNVPRETLAIPYYAKEKLFGFSLIGPKKNRRMYSHEDMDVFRTLASQTTLAIENCLFWQDQELHEQIKRQQSMDHFSASLAHEIDNPIFAVQCLVEMMKRSLAQGAVSGAPPDQGLLDNLEKINTNLQRISKMVKAVREFSSRTGGDLTVVDMSAAVDGFLEIFESQAKYVGVTFEKSVEAGIRVMGNKIYLEEVLMNLASNAVYAVQHVSTKDKKISLKISRNGPDMCLIEMRDNGAGIDKSLMEDIFLDFVTTKASTEGTGMGLARVRKIVDMHKGRVWAESDGAGKGAAFFVELPMFSG